MPRIVKYFIVMHYDEPIFICKTEDSARNYIDKEGGKFPYSVMSLRIVECDGEFLTRKVSCWLLYGVCIACGALLLATWLLGLQF